MKKGNETVLTTHVENFLTEQKSKSKAQNEVAIAMACLLSDVENGTMSLKDFKDYMACLNIDVDSFIDDYKEEQKAIYFEGKQEFRDFIEAEEKDAPAPLPKSGDSVMMKTIKGLAKNVIDSI